MGYNFEKYHGLGNDYIVIDPNKTKINLTKENIKLICHRNYGIGSDGILYGPIFKDDKISLRILNPDGSEAEKSGNGIRIFSRYLIESGYESFRKFTINTLGGEVIVEILDDIGKEIQVDMGKVSFSSNLIPVKGESRDVVDEELNINENLYKITCLSIGNPHCVIPLDDISKELVCEIGPAIENHSIFPNKINVQLMKIIDRNNIQIEIWERGAGYTLASGSSSCAAANAAYKLGETDNIINVHMPGGVIKVEIRNEGHVLMTGPVAKVCRGYFSEDLWELLK